MMINWSSVESDVLTAVESVLGAGWRKNFPGASAQIQALLATGRQIEQARSGPDPLSQDDYDALKIMQQRALEGVLLTYQGIGLISAQQAAAAAWQALTTALATVYPAMRLVL